MVGLLFFVVDSRPFQVCQNDIQANDLASFRLLLFVLHSYQDRFQEHVLEDPNSELCCSAVDRPSSYQHYPAEPA